MPATDPRPAPLEPTESTGHDTEYEHFSRVPLKSNYAQLARAEALRKQPVGASSSAGDTDSSEL